MESLPKEIVIEIVKYLNDEDRGSLRSASKHFLFLSPPDRWAIRKRRFYFWYRLYACVSGTCCNVKFFRRVPSSEASVSGLIFGNTSMFGEIYGLSSAPEFVRDFVRAWRCVYITRKKRVRVKRFERVARGLTHVEDRLYDFENMVQVTRKSYETDRQRSVYEQSQERIGTCALDIEFQKMFLLLVEMDDPRVVCDNPLYYLVNRLRDSDTPKLARFHALCEHFHLVLPKHLQAFLRRFGNAFYLSASREFFNALRSFFNYFGIAVRIESAQRDCGLRGYSLSV